MFKDVITFQTGHQEPLGSILTLHVLVADGFYSLFPSPEDVHIKPFVREEFNPSNSWQFKVCYLEVILGSV